MLAAALGLSVVLAFAVCGTVLECALSVMTTGALPFVFHWRRVVFAGTLFWFWYLTPLVAESQTALRLIRLIAQP